MTTLNLSPETTALIAPPDGAPDWPSVHVEVQSILGTLDGPIHLGVPWARIREHAMSSGGNMLFMSYREFGRDDRPGAENVLASVECWKLPDGTWKLSGDLSGEETGRMHHNAGDLVVPAMDMNAARKSAGGLARELVAHADQLVTALNELGEGVSQ